MEDRDLETLAHVLSKYGMLIGWLFLLFAHIALAVLAIALIWWLEITPKDVRALVQPIADSKELGVLMGALGFFGVALGAWLLHHYRNFLRRRISVLMVRLALDDP